ncbi:MAG TPA: WGxxGxxG-CTERM domain-containing protein [Chloroflexota bacterium]|nr:WGxxGxxG-CTERM domain-containing protein [Chloroflexota bacterium]
MRGFDWGLLGLFGLAGLAGLTRLTRPLAHDTERVGTCPAGCAGDQGADHTTL